MTSGHALFGHGSPFGSYFSCSSPTPTKPGCRRAISKSSGLSARSGSWNAPESLRKRCNRRRKLTQRPVGWRGCLGIARGSWLDGGIHGGWAQMTHWNGEAGLRGVPDNRWEADRSRWTAARRAAEAPNADTVDAVAVAAVAAASFSIGGREYAHSCLFLRRK